MDPKQKKLIFIVGGIIAAAGIIAVTGLAIMNKSGNLLKGALPGPTGSDYIKLSHPVAGEPSDFTFQITPTVAVPTGSSIEVYFPDQANAFDASKVTSAECNFSSIGIITTGNKRIVTLGNLPAVNNGVQIICTLNNIINPPKSTNPTDPFKIYIFNAGTTVYVHQFDGVKIENPPAPPAAPVTPDATTADRAVGVLMSGNAFISLNKANASITSTPSLATNEHTKLNVQFTLMKDLESGGSILIDFPDTFDTKYVDFRSCSPSSVNSFTTSGQSLFIKTNSIPKNTTINCDIRVLNPNTVGYTGDFHISTTNAIGQYSQMPYAVAGITLETSTLKNASVKITNTTAGARTPINIQFNTTHTELPYYAHIKVKFPAGFDLSYPKSVSCNIDGGQTITLDPLDKQIISINRIDGKSSAVSTAINCMIMGIFNPKKAGTYGPFTIITTGNVETYILDKNENVDPVIITADAVADLAEQLTAAQTAAKAALTAALATYKQTDYSPTNWITLTGFKSAGDTAINAAAEIAGIDAPKSAAIVGMAGVQTSAAADKLAADKLAADKLAADKLAADKLAADKLAADKLVADKLVADKLAADKLVADKAKADADKAKADAVQVTPPIPAKPVTNPVIQAPQPVVTKPPLVQQPVAQQPQAPSKPQTIAPPKPSQCAGPQTTAYPNDISGNFAEDLIKKLYDLCIIKGFDDGGYHPNDTISKVEGLKMIVLSAGIPEIKTCYDADCGTPFEDIIPWASGIARAAWDHKIIDGAKLFMPQKNMTRAEAVIMIVKAFGLQPHQGCYTANCGAGHPNNLFDDIDNSNSALGPFLREVWDKQIVQGKFPHKFHPNGAITRAEMAKIIIKAGQVSGKIKQ